VNDSDTASSSSPIKNHTHNGDTTSPSIGVKLQQLQAFVNIISQFFNKHCKINTNRNQITTTNKSIKSANNGSNAESIAYCTLSERLAFSNALWHILNPDEVLTCICHS
jgi:hypothetical protein